MNNVKYFAPKEKGEAIELLAEFGAKAVVLAGGTDLVPKINYYDLKPEVIIYIGDMGLGQIDENDGNLVVGAGTSFSSIIKSELLMQKANVLVQAAQKIGSTAIRNFATIGGNLANASPAADSATPLLVLNASLSLCGPDGERVVPLKEFFTGPGETVLGENEFISDVVIPVTQNQTACLKLGRRKSQTLSVLNAAVSLKTNGGTCENACIAVGAMAPTPMRCIKAEQALQGKKLDRDLILNSAKIAVEETEPIDDGRASAWYRRKAAGPVISRAIAMAADIEL